jgi:GT2 family glycosyltransferase
MLKRTSYFEDLERNQLNEIYYTDNVIGASMLIKREALLTIGLLDPVYFMYFEDNDYCRRAVYHGFKIAVVSQSAVYHNHSAKEGAKLPEKHSNTV